MAAPDPVEIKTPPPRLRAVHWLAAICGLAVLLLVIAMMIWWGALRETAMDPGVPYQTYTPPKPPDYAQASSWAIPPTQGASGPADVFFVHPTTYDGREWNAAIHAPKARRLLDEVMIPNYAGPFFKVGRVFAPLYRQASLYTTLTLREDAREARAFAYGDVKAAFEHYRAAYDQGRPLVIVGVGQGAVLAERLAREAAGDPVLKARIAAVYLIEAALPLDPGSPLPPCRAPEEAGCVAAFLGEADNDKRRTRDRLRHAPVWRGERLVGLAGRTPLCFNPLLGETTDRPAEPKENLGGANASGLEWGVRPGFLSHQVGAQCVDGVLRISRPRAPALRPSLNWTERQRVRPYNVFYADLEADALARVAAVSKPASSTK